MRDSPALKIFMPNQKAKKNPTHVRSIAVSSIDNSCLGICRRRSFCFEFAYVGDHTVPALRFACDAGVATM